MRTSQLICERTPHADIELLEASERGNGGTKKDWLMPPTPPQKQTTTNLLLAFSRSVRGIGVLESLPPSGEGATWTEVIWLWSREGVR